jgi:Flp pilus assembly protein TadG
VGGNRVGNYLPGTRETKKGQELVEFAVMLPLLLIVLIGVIDLGRVFHASITIANASRAGARYASSYGFDDTGGVITINNVIVSTKAQSEAQNSGVTLDSVSVTCPGGCSHGGPVIVTVTHDFQFLFNAFLGSGITLNHSTEMKIPW